MAQDDSRTPRRITFVTKAMQPLVLLALMWVVRIADQILPGSWNAEFGLQSWSLSGLSGIVLSPLLHSGWPHLLSNTLPFLVLGLLVALDGPRRFWIVTGITALVGGLGTWAVNSPGTITVGSSGLVFGYLGYLLTRAFVARSLGHGILYAMIGIGVGLIYGGMVLSGIFGAPAGVSWQAHLFGAIGGAVAAIATRPKRDE